jgi:hypothetical protein
MPDQTPEPLTDDAGVLAPCCQYSHTRMTCETDCGNCNVCRLTARIAELEAKRDAARDVARKMIDSRARDIVAEEAAQPFPAGYVTGFLNDQDRVTGLEHVAYPTRVQAVERAESASFNSGGRRVRTAEGRAVSTHIEWTDETKQCAKCREHKPHSEFARDKSRADGLTYWCRACRNSRARSSYAPKPGPETGRRFVAPRDGDVLQARRRVNYLVEIGHLPPANKVLCADCGHEWAPGERRHEYDHYLGYSPEHHEDVQAVCTTCHHARENLRRAA